MDSIELLLTFQSVNHTMMVEKSLINKGFKIKTIPTPREISNSCGLSILTDYENLDKLQKLMEDGEKILHIWRYKKIDGQKSAEKII